MCMYILQAGITACLCFLPDDARRFPVNTGESLMSHIYWWDALYVRGCIQCRGNAVNLVHLYTHIHTAAKSYLGDCVTLLFLRGTGTKALQKCVYGDRCVRTFYNEPSRLTRIHDSLSLGMSKGTLSNEIMRSYRTTLRSQIAENIVALKVAEVTQFSWVCESIDENFFPNIVVYSKITFLDETCWTLM